MKKYKFNEEKFLRNFVIFSSGLSIGILVYKVASCGIAWISTIRILRIGGQNERNLERCS